MLSPICLRTSTSGQGRLVRWSAHCEVDLLEWSSTAYAGEGDRSHPELSPVGAARAGLPPTHLSVGTAESFLPELRELHVRLIGAGVEVDYLEASGAPRASDRDAIAGTAGR